MSKEQPQVGLIMGSQSDWETMSLCAELMDQLGIAFEAEVVSAHRTPEKMFEYAATAESRGIQVIIAAAGGAAACRLGCVWFVQKKTGPRLIGPVGESR